MLTKFQFHCSITCRNILYFVLTSILSHLMTSSVPNLHNTKLWISLERHEIWQKWKHHSSSLLKAFQIHLFFNTSIFHFIGTLKLPWRLKLVAFCPEHRKWDQNHWFILLSFVIWGFPPPGLLCSPPPGLLCDKWSMRVGS